MGAFSTDVAGATALPAAPSASEGSDWQLLARVAGGDGEAMGELVERHQERLLRLCERLLGDAEEARDAAQDVLLKLFRSAGSFKPRGQLYTLIYRIATNHCLNKLRRRRLVPFLSLGRDSGEEEELPALDPPDPAADPAAALEARRRWHDTRRAIAALPPSQRAVLVLTRFEELSYKEVAAVLGITVGAVESRLFRALRGLERRLDRGPQQGSERRPEAAQERAAWRVSQKGDER